MNPVHSDSKNRARFANVARSACAKGTTAFRAERNLAAFARNQPFNLIIGGRLGAFKYYDMDKSIAAALEVEI